MSNRGPQPAAGRRRGERAHRPASPRKILLAATGVVALACWGVLVWLAIGFGRSARGGDGSDWWTLLLASVAAAAFLFACLLAWTAALRRGSTSTAPTSHRH